ncbi:hypothetical protein N866_20520 [Actinotalea ferrariae CF5-4]|uniref:Uncharacterized protein n=1 Tax=Actinotalea ferrariae CF5-4 TaxID=948458 RepID=A0A021VTT9_9CELL|nr:hypothetical protein [Actinotalea ferrariae]EYR63450.1 hypothetical protein N866_20520 [Actinotalea ferrariae CF5-4]
MAAAPHYSGWLVTHADPQGPAMLAPPRRAVVTTETYGGHRITVQAFAIARAPGYVCVQQHLPGRSPWNAWVPEDRVRPA